MEMPHEGKQGNGVDSTLLSMALDMAQAIPCNLVYTCDWHREFACAGKQTQHCVATRAYA